MAEVTQQEALARASREAIRHEKEEGFVSEVKCWKDEPEQCENLPLAHIKLLDGPCYYTCRTDAAELLEGVPTPPYKAGDRKGN